MAKARLPIHCFLLALFPILNLYIQNIGEIPILDIAGPAVFVLALVAVLAVVLSLVLRSPRKAALLVSLLLIYSFTYSAALQAVRSALDAGQRVLLPLYTIALAVASIATLRARSDLRRLTTTFHVASTMLLLLAIARIAAFGFQNPSATIPAAGAFGSSDADLGTTSFTSASERPDIYYFIFDRYPSREVLQEFYGYDNSEFIDRLTRLGFQVVQDAHANYPMTHLSLASSLNLDYLGPTYQGRLSYRPLMRRNRVVRDLKAAGYRYIHVGSWYEPTRVSPLADRNVHHPLMLSEFAKALIRTTPYQLLVFRDQMAKEALYSLEKLHEIPAEPGPKFVFLHMLMPHPPYLFSSDGSLARSWQGAPRTEAESFIEQLRFLNSRVLRVVETILAKSPAPPIIILQADEGPLLDSKDSSLSRAEMWRKRSGILNAYLLPGSGPPLPRDITPVNSFRYLFRRYFRSSLELLPNRVYYWADTKPNGMAKDLYGEFPFIDITEELKPVVAAVSDSAPGP